MQRKKSLPDWLVLGELVHMPPDLWLDDSPERLTAPFLHEPIKIRRNHAMDEVVFMPMDHHPEYPRDDLGVAHLTAMRRSDREHVGLGEYQLEVGEGPKEWCGNPFPGHPSWPYVRRLWATISAMMHLHQAGIDGKVLRKLRTFFPKNRANTLDVHRPGTFGVGTFVIVPDLNLGITQVRTPNKPTDPFLNLAFLLRDLERRTHQAAASAQQDICSVSRGLHL